jgi:hypothetical protein
MTTPTSNPTWSRTMTAPLFPHIVQLDAAAPAPTPARGRNGAWRTTLGLVLGTCAIALSIAAVRHLVADSRPPARQVARVALLPDTPPPPPPPKVERKEEPKPEPRPQQQPEKQPKADTPPQPAPLKMEGAAGNGPSAFAAGAVTKDYQGGAPVIGGAGGEPGLDRAQQRLYANSVRQALHDELERQLGPDAPDIDAQVTLWISPDGRIARWELQGDRPALDAALQRCAAALQLAAPASVPQPMRFRLSLHSSG